MAILVDFQCCNCGINFEGFYSRGLETYCPNCKSSQVKKLVSSPAQLITNAADSPKHRTSNRLSKGK